MIQAIKKYLIKKALDKEMKRLNEIKNFNKLDRKLIFPLYEKIKEACNN